MSDKAINKHEHEVVEALASKSGVKAADVAKILSYLGLTGALQNRLAVSGKLPADSNVRIAVGQILQ